MKTLNKTDSAAIYLRDQIKKKVWKNGQRLPDHRTLAAMADVGQRAMWNALHVLKNENKITFKHGSGIFAGPTIPAQKTYSTKEPFKRKWVQTKEKLQKDILTGMFRSEGRLPSMKELIAEYGVNFRTMKKSLHTLVDEGLIAQNKKKLCITLNMTVRPSNTIYLVMSTKIASTELYPHCRERIEGFFCALEEECNSRNVQLVKVAWSKNLHIENPGSLLGIVLWQSLDLYNETPAMAFFLRKYGKPAVVVCMPGEFIYHSTLSYVYAQFQKVPGCFICNSDLHFLAGSQMARFLLSKNHRKICFISSDPEGLFDMDIIEGLQSMFLKAGVHDAIVRLSFLEIPLEELQALVTESDKAFEKTIESEIKILDDWLASVRSQFSPHYANRITAELFEIKTTRNIRSYYAGLFRKALSVSNATAWVFSDDFCACNGGMEFLRAAGISFPHQIGIAGMTNYQQSLIDNLTSYKYDYAGAARKAVSLIAFPAYAKKVLCRKGTNTFDIDGTVIDRGSL